MAILYKVQCEWCGTWHLPDESCETCEEYRKAHELLYGDQECRMCQRILVTLDDQQHGWCRRCAGIDDDEYDEEG
jgi:hypothetical protein